MKQTRSTKQLITSLMGSAAIFMSAPAVADPSFGLGLSFRFGGGQVETGVGLRVFSDNRSDSVVGSVGLDYMFSSGDWRGTVGAAYLEDRGYLGLDLGIDLNDGALDFGIGAGGVIGEDLDTGGGAEDTPEDTDEDTI